MASIETDPVAEFLREHDRDRYLTDLFIAAEFRPAVMALHAFNAEAERIRNVVSEPMPGEIRLQWWRDVVTGERAGEGRAHPVAGALLDAVSRYNLPTAALDRLAEARIFDLYDDPMPSLADLEGYCGDTASALFQLGAIIAADGKDPDVADASGHGGIAYALAGLMRDLPMHAARGQCFIPEDLMAAHGVDRAMLAARESAPEIDRLLASLREIARDHLSKSHAAMREAPDAVRAVFLPLALVEPCLKRLERSGDPFAAGAGSVSQWRRQWALWRAARRGGV